jgi:hypothetical protein
MSGGLGQRYLTPNSWEKGEGEKEEKIVVSKAERKQRVKVFYIR